MSFLIVPKWIFNFSLNSWRVFEFWMLAGSLMMNSFNDSIGSLVKEGNREWIKLRRVDANGWRWLGNTSFEVFTGTRKAATISTLGPECREVLSFPTVYCGQIRAVNCKLTYTDIAKSEARNADRRACLIYLPTNYCTPSKRVKFKKIEDIFSTSR